MNILMLLCTMAQLNALDPAATSGDAPDESAPARVVVALDCSGSLRRDFSAVQGCLLDIIQALPEASGAALIRFDETAAEFARTANLTEPQRKIIMERAASLAPSGRWTDFAAAVAQVRTSVDELGPPTLVVFLTDAVSDPGAGGEFTSLDSLLVDAFGGREDVATLILTPAGAALEEPAAAALVPTAVLGDLSARDLLALMPPPSPPPVAEPRTESIGPEESIVQYLPEPPVQPEAREPSRPLPAGALAAAIALLSALLAWIAWPRRPAVPVQNGTGETEKREPPGFELIARTKGARFHLGPLAELNTIRMGRNVACDVPVALPGEADAEIVLSNDGCQLHLHNGLAKPILVNTTELAPDETGLLRLPARIAMPNGQFIGLGLRRIPERVVPSVPNPKQEDLRHEPAK